MSRKKPALGLDPRVGTGFRNRTCATKTTAVAPDDIRELFSVFGAVEVRRLFGGAGIYADGTMFALVHDGVIYLKVDERNAAAFERENLEPFSYRRRGERAS